MSADPLFLPQGVSGKCGPAAATGSQSVSAAAESMVTKSLDNIVGSLWQARQESSGSSMGNQVRTRERQRVRETEGERDTQKQTEESSRSVFGIGDRRRPFTVSL